MDADGEGMGSGTPTDHNPYRQVTVADSPPVEPRGRAGVVQTMSRQCKESGIFFAERGLTRCSTVRLARNW